MSLPSIALTPDAQGRPTCLSTDVALHFQKKHLHVLRDIDRILSVSPSERKSNFGFTFIDVPGPNGAVRQVRAYRLTRDAFSILAMGFTGSAAIRWKWRYIEAFNAMEKALHDGQASDLFLAGARAAAQRLAGEERARLADCALALLDEGLSQREVGDILHVSRWTVGRLKKRFSFMVAPQPAGAERMTQGVLL